MKDGGNLWPQAGLIPTKGFSQENRNTMKSTEVYSEIVHSQFF